MRRQGQLTVSIKEQDNVLLRGCIALLRASVFSGIQSFNIDHKGRSRSFGKCALPIPFSESDCFYQYRSTPAGNEQNYDFSRVLIVYRFIIDVSCMIQAIHIFLNKIRIIYQSNFIVSRRSWKVSFNCNLDNS